jgi:hypothetical protein
VAQDTAVARTNLLRGTAIALKEAFLEKGSFMANRASSRAGKVDTAVEGRPAPRLPHERDESSDNAGSAPREIIRRAQVDVEAGRVDTDRGPPADAAYRKQKEAPVRHNRKP